MEETQESEKIAARIDCVALWMRDITVQHVATPHSRVRRDFASGAVRLVQLLPLQLRPLEVAQPLARKELKNQRRSRPELTVYLCGCATSLSNMSQPHTQGFVVISQAERYA